MIHYHFIYDINSMSPTSKEIAYQITNCTKKNFPWEVFYDPFEPFDKADDGDIAKTGVVHVFYR